jgi:hypothetical protein
LLGRFSAGIAAGVAVADKVTAHYQAALAFGEALTAQQWDELAILVDQAKMIADQVSLEVTHNIFQATGARSTANDMAWTSFGATCARTPCIIPSSIALGRSETSCSTRRCRNRANWRLPMPEPQTSASPVKVRALTDDDQIVAAHKLSRTELVGLPHVAPAEAGLVRVLIEPGRIFGAFIAGGFVGTTNSCASRLAVPGRAGS